MEDKTLTCKDCARPFVFSTREQQFFAEKGFQNQPHRCRECRQARRANSGGDSATARPGARRNYEAVCAACGVETAVQFRPRGDRPVYCHACFSAQVPAGV